MVRRYVVDTRRLGIARPCDRRLISYDIEMTEVTGGTFWKPYTPGQIAGTEPYPTARPLGMAADGSSAGADGTSEEAGAASGLAAGTATAEPSAEASTTKLDMSSVLDDTKSLMAWRGPIDLGNKRLRRLAAAIGPSWVRVSGSWATGTYYDFDGHTGGSAPKPYRAVLTRAQWEGVLDFVRAVRGKLLVSFAVVPGLGNAECRDLGGTGAWDPAQVRLLLDAAAGHGVPVSAVEFCNEPNISFMGAAGSDGGPYVPTGYAQDQDAFYRMMRAGYPGVLLVGPCGAMDPVTPELAALPLVRAMGDSLVTSGRLLDACHEAPDVFSYHIYGGISERGASFGRHWDADEAASDAALDVADAARRYYEPLRDRLCPGVPLWVTESGDANCGGNTWGSTFLDVFRQADELARFAQAAPDGALFHNTLASSDYGLLDQDDFSPRPNWWLLWLWRQLVGDGAYDPGRLGLEGSAGEGRPHVYAFARDGHILGVTLVAINNSQVDELVLDLPVASERFTLSSAAAPVFGFVSTGQLRSGEALLNGEPLKLGEEDRLPNLLRLAVRQPRGKVTLQPGTVSFLRLCGIGRK